MTEDRIITQMTIPRDRTALPARELWPEVGTTLFADDPEKVAPRNVHMPMGRFGRAEEVAATVAFLASDDAGYVTASAFPLDGGITSAYTIPG